MPNNDPRVEAACKAYRLALGAAYSIPVAPFGSANSDYENMDRSAMKAALAAADATSPRKFGCEAEDEAFEIGKADGYANAMQEIDMATGGDGEYRYCMGGADPDRHCPDAETMKRRIIERFQAPAPSPWRPIEEAPKDGTFIDVINRYGERTTDVTWEDGAWLYYPDAEGGDIARLVVEPPPVFWMPLPPLPQKEGE